MKMIIRKVLGKNSKEDSVYATLEKYFDQDFYRKAYPDVAAAGIDPLRHFIDHGHGEGRNPTSSFSTTAYLARYPDVRESGMNSFLHYVEFGRYENRDTWPCEPVGEPHPRAEQASFTPDGEETWRARRLSDFFENLDKAKVDRLLGSAIADRQPRAWIIGKTTILPATSGSDAENPAPTTQAEAGLPLASEDHADLAQEILAAARGKTLSLDLWDTILRRHCAPDEVKLRHSRVLWLTHVALGHPLCDLHPIDLYQLRRIAEAEVADEHFEYRIADVAARLAPLMQVPGSDFVRSFLDRELRIERSAISADPLISRVLREHQGRKVILSDFYMPASAIRDLLDGIGMGPFDRIYSSSDYMATKRAGDLYRTVLAQEKIAPTDIVHVGDRYTSDVTSARRQGLSAIHYDPPELQPELKRWDQNFWNHLDGNSEGHARSIVASLIADCEDQPSVETLSVAVCGFVLHVMEEALRRRVDKVFFMTREGTFFRRIYDLLVEIDVCDVGTYPPSADLEVSRRATFAASLEDFAIEPLMRLWSQYSTQSLAALAASLGIDLAEWQRTAERLGIDVDQPIRYPWQDSAFLDFISRPVILRSGREAIARQCEALMHYLAQAGFEPHEDKQRLVVDIGWRGTIQDNLAAIVSGRIHGCYFGLERFLNPQPRNATKTGFVFDAPRGFPLSIPEVAGFEFLFNSPGGSTLGYANGKAVRELIAEEEAVVCGPVAALQQRMLAAARQVADYVRRHGLVSRDILDVSREIVDLFAKRPPVEVAEAFFDLSHNESFGAGIVQSMGFDPSALGTLHQLEGASLHGTVTGWLEGLRWQAAAQRLPMFVRNLTSLSIPQKLSLPVQAPAIVRCGSLGQTKVAVLSPPPIKGSGGHRTIFNLVSALASRGYDVHLLHECPPDPDTREWISSILGDAPVTQYSSWLNWLAPTASIATIWYSTKFVSDYWATSQNGFYFVQDYEALFNPVGDTYIRAVQSYTSGLNHICVGRWLSHVLRAEFGVGVASGGLGVDHKVYRPLADVERNPKRIALLFQPEKSRRAPDLCAAALRIVKAKEPEAEIVIYGSETRPDLPFDYEHRGLIADVDAIARLYSSSAAGLCISSTNPSRIPFEMMASGCVPVDIYRYNNLFDYDAGTGLLAHESPESLASALLMLLGDQEKRIRRMEQCRESVKHRSLRWEMDVAVNAVDYGIEGGTFDLLPAPLATYSEEPVVAEEVDSSSVRYFLEHQARLAGLPQDAHLS